MERKNDVKLRQKVRRAEKKIDKARLDIQQESEKLSSQIAEHFVNKLIVKGDNV